MTIWFWERWLIKWAMHNLHTLLPHMANATYAQLERYGIADFQTREFPTQDEPARVREIWILPE